MGRHGLLTSPLRGEVGRRPGEGCERLGRRTAVRRRSRRRHNGPTRERDRNGRSHAHRRSIGRLYLGAQAEVPVLHEFIAIFRIFDYSVPRRNSKLHKGMWLKTRFCGVLLHAHCVLRASLRAGPPDDPKRRRPTAVVRASDTRRVGSRVTGGFHLPRDGASSRARSIVPARRLPGQHVQRNRRDVGLFRHIRLFDERRTRFL